MFFTLTGRVIGWIVLVFGLLRLAMAVLLAFASQQEVPHRYLRSQTTGQAIDHSMIAIGYAIVIGILTEISRSAAERNT